MTALLSAGTHDMMIGDSGDNVSAFPSTYMYPVNDNFGNRTAIGNASATSSKLDCRAFGADLPIRPRPHRSAPYARALKAARGR
jgi:hypothetical protein